MKYAIWNCGKDRFAANERFSSEHVAQALANYMNEDLAEPLYAVVVDLKEEACF